MSNISNLTKIIMIEDDRGHARLIEKNIRRSGVTNDIAHFENGSDALSYLSDSFKNKDEKSHLVLLDLNLPDMSGTEILKTIKENGASRRTPVIVLTTTDDKKEIQKCYDLGCSVYIRKPVSYETFSDAIRKLGLFISVIEVPSQSQT